jgi:hypothetical protein
MLKRGWLIGVPSKPKVKIVNTGNFTPVSEMRDVKLLTNTGERIRLSDLNTQIVIVGF